MAKRGASKPKPVPNKHLHSRVSYLYQACTYLATQENRNATGDQEPAYHAFPPGLPYYYASHMHSVSKKSQVRLSRNIKRSMCKQCNSILIPGHSSSSKLENLSRGGKKPWADVMVIECSVCGAHKRFPIGAKQQRRKIERTQVKKGKPDGSRQNKNANARGASETLDNHPQAGLANCRRCGADSRCASRGV